MDNRLPFEVEEDNRLAAIEASRVSCDCGCKRGKVLPAVRDIHQRVKSLPKRSFDIPDEMTAAKNRMLDNMRSNREGVRIYQSI